MRRRTTRIAKINSFKLKSSANFEIIICVIYFKIALATVLIS